MLFWGSNGSEDKVYVMDLATGAELSSFVVSQSVQAPRVIY